jgi:hypothetical protein
VSRRFGTEELMPVSVNKKMLPKYYIAFQWLFSTPGHENITKHFIEDCTEVDEIEEIEFINPYDVKTVKNQYEEKSDWCYTLGE